jgi:hypothetical protein
VQFSNLWPIVIGVAVLLLFVLLAKKIASQKRELIEWPVYAKKPLTQPEQILYWRLIKALPRFCVLRIVLAQVQCPRVLGVRGGFNFHEWNNRINRLRETLNKSPRCSAPWFGMQRKEKSTDIAEAMASIFDAAMRPKQGCNARGTCSVFPSLRLRDLQERRHRRRRYRTRRQIARVRDPGGARRQETARDRSGRRAFGAVECREDAG